MIYLLVGYMWLFIHRPFEVWPRLGALHVERVYVIFCLVYWLLLAKKTWVSNRLNLAFGFLWSVCLAAWLISPYPDAGRGVAEEYYKYIVFYLLVMTTVRGEKDLKTLTAGCLVVFGVYMTHSLREFQAGRYVSRQSITRMIGIDETFSDPNTFASSILYALPLTLAFWPEVKSRWPRRLLLYYTGLTVLCILLTGSRSGFVGLVVFGVLALRRLFRNKLLLLLMICAVPVGFLALPESLQNRFRSIIDPEAAGASAKASAEGRGEGFKNGIKIWQRYPLLGAGPGAHGPALGQHAQAHNVYGQVLSETGTLGGLALLGVIGCLLLNAREIHRLRRAMTPPVSSFPANVSTAVLITVAMLLVKGWSDHNLFRYTWLWFGAFQAIAVDCMRSASFQTSAGLGGGPGPRNSGF